MGKEGNGHQNSLAILFAGSTVFRRICSKLSFFRLRISWNRQRSIPQDIRFLWTRTNSTRVTSRVSTLTSPTSQIGRRPGCASMSERCSIILIMATWNMPFLWTNWTLSTALEEDQILTSQWNVNHINSKLEKLEFSFRSNIHLNDALGNFSLTLIDTLDTLYVSFHNIPATCVLYCIDRWFCFRFWEISKSFREQWS